MTVRNIQNVSATNMRVNLTEVIGDLDNENIVAVTKHKKVIAYVISPEVYNALAGIEPEDVADDSPPAEPDESAEASQAVEDTEEETETSQEPDPSLDDLEFEDYDDGGGIEDFDTLLKDLNDRTRDLVA